MKLQHYGFEDIECIKDINDILEIEKIFKDKHKNLEDGTYTLFYRGQSNKNWELEPSILRNKDLNEYNLIKDCIDEELLIDTNVSLFSLIARAQHYNIPTRFLDFTSNILIATYFACKGSPECDGAIYLCDYGVIRPKWTHTILISEMCVLQEPISVQKFTENLMSKYKDVFLKYEHEGTEYLNMSIMSFADHGFTVFPSSEDYNELEVRNPRIFRQKGGFFICGNKFKAPITNRDRWLSSSGRNIMLPEINEVPYNSIINHRFKKRIIISGFNKKRLLEQLDEMNINEVYLVCK